MVSSFLARCVQLHLILPKLASRFRVPNICRWSKCAANKIVQAFARSADSSECAGWYATPPGRFLPPFASLSDEESEARLEYWVSALVLLPIATVFICETIYCFALILQWILNRWLVPRLSGYVAIPTHERAQPKTVVLLSDSAFVPVNCLYHVYCAFLVAQAYSVGCVSMGNGIAWEVWFAWQSLMMLSHICQTCLRCCLRLPAGMHAKIGMSILMSTVPLLSEPLDSMKDWVICGMCAVISETSLENWSWLHLLDWLVGILLIVIDMAFSRTEDAIKPLKNLLSVPVDCFDFVRLPLVLPQLLFLGAFALIALFFPVVFLLVATPWCLLSLFIYILTMTVVLPFACVLAFSVGWNDQSTDFVVRILKTPPVQGWVLEQSWQHCLDAWNVCNAPFIIFYRHMITGESLLLLSAYVIIVSHYTILSKSLLRAELKMNYFGILEARLPTSSRESSFRTKFQQIASQQFADMTGPARLVVAVDENWPQGFLGILLGSLRGHRQATFAVMSGVVSFAQGVLIPLSRKAIVRWKLGRLFGEMDSFQEELLATIKQEVLEYWVSCSTSKSETLKIIHKERPELKDNVKGRIGWLLDETYPVNKPVYEKAKSVLELEVWLHQGKQEETESLKHCLRQFMDLDAEVISKILDRHLEAIRNLDISQYRFLDSTVELWRSVGDESNSSITLLKSLKTKLKKDAFVMDGMRWLFEKPQEDEGAGKVEEKEKEGDGEIEGKRKSQKRMLRYRENLKKRKTWRQKDEDDQLRKEGNMELIEARARERDEWQNQENEYEKQRTAALQTNVGKLEEDYDSGFKNICQGFYERILPACHNEFFRLEEICSDESLINISRIIRKIEENVGPEWSNGIGYGSTDVLFRQVETALCRPPEPADIIKTAENDVLQWDQLDSFLEGLGSGEAKRKKKFPIYAKQDWIEIPYGERYMEKIGEARGRKVRGNDILKTAISKTVTFAQLLAFEGKDLQNHFPIKVKKKDGECLWVPYGQSYMKTVRQFLGGSVEKTDVLQTAEILRFDQLAAMKGDELQSRFPIKAKKKDVSPKGLTVAMEELREASSKCDDLQFMQLIAEILKVFRHGHYKARNIKTVAKDFFRARDPEVRGDVLKIRVAMVFKGRESSPRNALYEAIDVFNVFHKTCKDEAQTVKILREGSYPLVGERLGAFAEKPGVAQAFASRRIEEIRLLMEYDVAILEKRRMTIEDELAVKSLVGGRGRSRGVLNEICKKFGMLHDEICSKEKKIRFFKESEQMQEQIEALRKETRRDIAALVQKTMSDAGCESEKLKQAEDSVALEFHDELLKLVTQIEEFVERTKA